MENNRLAQGEKYFQETRTASFRKEKFQYIHTGIIDKDGETWTTTELDEANIFQVYNQYRAKHGIPFPDEIIGLRKHYGLSAAKMAQILGFGINQYRMYEDGEVPSISNARAIIAAREKDVFKSFLEASKSEMSEAEFIRTKNKVENANGDYLKIGVPSEFSGFRSLSNDKITAAVKILLSQMGPTFVTKMNKLLFYADFICYKRHGYGMTGLKYRALQFGPVPNDWPKVYSSLHGIAMEEYVYPSGQSGIMLKSIDSTLSDVLEEREISVLEDICNLFTDKNAGEISNISHQEKAWIENHTTHSEISYQNAFALNY